jgi:hypothetical protein
MSTMHPARSPRGDSRHSSVSATGSARLAAYLAAGVGASMVGTPDAEAAVVSIDLTSIGGFNITGTNGGVSSGSVRKISNWLGSGSGSGTLAIYNDFQGSYGRYWGVSYEYPSNLRFLTIGGNLGGVPATSLALSLGSPIGPSSGYFGASRASTFRFTETSPNWGGSRVASDYGAGSFFGFYFGTAGNQRFGYLEMTWSASTNTFQILSGAYESTANTAILAGATPTPVPAPSALALLALGGGAFRRARARAA